MQAAYMLRVWLKKRGTCRPCLGSTVGCGLVFSQEVVSSEAGRECPHGGGVVREVASPIPEARLPSLSSPGHIMCAMAWMQFAPADVILIAPALALAIASGVSGVHGDLAAPTGKRLKDKSLKAGLSHSYTSAQGLKLYWL